MMRPMQLELAPHERYPATRDNVTPPSNSITIADMPHMAAFVYDFYLQRVSSMKTIIQVSPELRKTLTKNLVRITLKVR